MKKLFKYLGILLVLFFVWVVFFYISIIFVVFDDPFDNRYFVSQVWIEHKEDMSADNPRGVMFEDLVGNYLRVGMSRDEVIGLLGPPDRSNTQGQMSYNLGMWSGFRIDYDSLELEFSNRNELTRYYRVQH